MPYDRKHVDEFLARHGLKDEHRSISFGPGWVNLLDELVIKIKAAGWNGEIDCIKEKFGGLRFYVDQASNEIWDMIAEAECKSLRICEKCEAPGRMYQRGAAKGTRYGWMLTLCEPHGVEWENTK